MHKPQVWGNPAHFLAFGFGSGLAPKAPGTFGTLAAIPFAVGLMMLPIWWALFVVVIAFFVGVWACEVTSRDMGVHDFGGIVWDEFVGLFITVLAVPISLSTVITAFVLFRFFDIVKPWPIRWLDKHVDGGMGIMIDDVIAGVFSWLLLQGLMYQGWLV